MKNVRTIQRLAGGTVRIVPPVPRARPIFGLGDAVAAVAQPIAGAIDRVAGTKLKGCGGCKGRRRALNRAVPNLIPPFLRTINKDES